MKQKSLCFICILLLGNIYISGFALDPLAQASDLSIAFIQREPQNPSWIGQIEIKESISSHDNKNHQYENIVFVSHDVAKKFKVTKSNLPWIE